MSPPARLHVVTDDEVLARDGWMARAREVLEAGGPRIALHVRGPRTEGGRLFALTSKLLGAARREGATLIVNDRVDVALALGGGAVHLGLRSLEPGVVRHLMGPEALIGLSCHAASDVQPAVRAGVDYVFVGHVFPTPSHPGAESLGVAGVAAAVGVGRSLPVIAIGGVSPGRVGEVTDAGAWGVACVRGVWDAARPAEAVSEYISVLPTVEGA